MSTRFSWRRTCLELQGCTLLDVYFNRLEPFGASGACYSKMKKKASEKQIKIAQTLVRHAEYYQTATSCFFVIWFELDRDFHDDKTIGTASFGGVYRRLRFNIPGISKLTGLISLHSQVICFIVGGLGVVVVSVFPSHPSTVLIKTNWMEGMVQAPPRPLPNLRATISALLIPKMSQIKCAMLSEDMEVKGANSLSLLLSGKGIINSPPHSREIFWSGRTDRPLPDHKEMRFYTSQRLTIFFFFPTVEEEDRENDEPLNCLSLVQSKLSLDAENLGNCGKERQEKTLR